MKNIFKTIFITYLLTIFNIGLVKSNVDTVKYMYVSLKGDNKIAVYRLLKNGNPEYIYSENVSGGPASLTTDPQKKFLYVAQRSSNSLSAYTINSLTGKLTLINSISAVDNPVYISTDKTGKYLLSAYYNANKAAIYEINPDGSLNPNVIKTIVTHTNPHAILTDNSNKYLYVTAMTGNSIEQFSFDESSGNFSVLTPDQVIPATGTCPRHFVFHKAHPVMYVVNEVGNSVTTYSIENDGTLIQKQVLKTLPASFTGTSKCADIHLTPDNKFLYASNRGFESVTAFEIDANKDTLRFINNYPTVKSPREMDLSPDGNYLYVAGETNGDLAYYKVNHITGILDSISTFISGTTPSWVLTVEYENNTTQVNNEIKLNIPLAKMEFSPNPFMNTTFLNYEFPGPGFYFLTLFDTNGRSVTKVSKIEVKNGEKEVKVSLDSAEKLNSGVYKAILQNSSGNLISNAILVKI